MNETAMVLCRTPTRDKAPTRIPLWKFETIREAILQILRTEPEGIRFKDLAHEVEGLIQPEARDRIGSLQWHVTTVKLEMEVRGEIERVAGMQPQRLRQKGTVW